MPADIQHHEEVDNFHSMLGLSSDHEYGPPRVLVPMDFVLPGLFLQIDPPVLLSISCTGS